MNESDFLKQYIDAAKDSTSRARQILLVLIGASILIYAAFWNSRSGGWANTRLALARATEHILSHEEERKKNPKIGELQVPPGEEDLYAIAGALAYRSGRTLFQAQQSLALSQRIRSEQLGHIQAPIPGIGGISFDVNDLGMFGGLIILVLLLWEYCSLWHHVNNLKLAFEFARDIGVNELDEEGKNRLLYHTYQNLAMHQVLTIPPKPASSRRQEVHKLKVLVRKVPLLLYALPLLVQTTVIANDWYTRDIGKLIDHNATSVVLVTGTTTWFLVVVLTVLCFYEWRESHITWKKVARTI